MGVDDILTSGKEEYAAAVIAEAQRKLDAAEIGISLQMLELTDVKMPEEVRETYEQVNAATVDASTKLQEAQQYQNTMVPYAESIANAVLAAAQTDRSTKIAAATSDLAEFNGLLEEINTNQTPPGVIRARVYNEKMTEALTKIGKVRLVDDGDSKIFIDWE
jgi:regulator of protease activity HflC (stomatin/prohibitin superfamily)